MTNSEFILLVGGGSLIAGFLGSITGLGGGVVIVPLLTLVFGVDLLYAIGASLVSVIATSSGAAATYVKEGYSNIRIGMFLEVATTCGALAGAVVATLIPLSATSILFGIVLLLSAYFSGRKRSESLATGPSDRIADLLSLPSTYPTSEGPLAYSVRRVPMGFGLMFVAGMLSGILEIGSGALKVLAMDQAMNLPFKVSTTTSNFMIGVTAAASAGIYLSRGYIDPAVGMPVILGVLVGAPLGSLALARLNTKILRPLFALVVIALGVEMIVEGLLGKFA